MAINDYLKGPDYFYNLDIVKRNNEIREIAKHKMNLFKGIFVTPFIAIGYAFKLLFKYNNAKRLYLKDVDKLTSEQYWLEVFNNGK